MPRARKPQAPSLSDMPSTGYGTQSALMASDQAVPSQPMVSPDEIANLSDPSTRPDEPVTAGLPSGAGVGPEALGGATETDPTREALQAMLLVEPNNDIMRLIDLLDIMGR